MYLNTCLLAVLSNIHFELLIVLGLNNAFRMFYDASQQNKFSKPWMSLVDACHCSIRQQAELFQKKINSKRDAVQERRRRIGSVAKSTFVYH
jgi:hypothetical protein